MWLPLITSIDAYKYNKQRVYMTGELIDKCSGVYKYLEKTLGCSCGNKKWDYRNDCYLYGWYLHEKQPKHITGDVSKMLNALMKVNCKHIEKFWSEKMDLWWGQEWRKDCMVVDVKEFLQNFIAHQVFVLKKEMKIEKGLDRLNVKRGTIEKKNLGLIFVNLMKQPSTNINIKVIKRLNSMINAQYQLREIMGVKCKVQKYILDGENGEWGK